jgi:hypothetical protein
LTEWRKEVKMVIAADVAELADAQASGACELWLVEVRLLSSALHRVEKQSIAGFLKWFTFNRLSFRYLADDIQY